MSHGPIVQKYVPFSMAVHFVGRGCGVWRCYGSVRGVLDISASAPRFVEKEAVVIWVSQMYSLVTSTYFKGTCHINSYHRFIMVHYGLFKSSLSGLTNLQWLTQFLTHFLRQLKESDNSGSKLEMANKPRLNLIFNYEALGEISMWDVGLKFQRLCKAHGLEVEYFKQPSQWPREKPPKGLTVTHHNFMRFWHPRFGGQCDSGVDSCCFCCHPTTWTTFKPIDQWGRLRPHLQEVSGKMFGTIAAFLCGIWTLNGCKPTEHRSIQYNLWYYAFGVSNSSQQTATWCSRSSLWFMAAASVQKVNSHDVVETFSQITWIPLRYCSNLLLAVVGS